MVNWNETTLTEMDELEFVNLRAEMKENDGANFKFDRVRRSTDAGTNNDKEVITLINLEEGKAASVWVSIFEDAKFEQNPESTDGARLGKALARKFGSDGASKDDVIAKANEEGGLLTVTKNDYQDSWAWLWQIV